MLQTQVSLVVKNLPANMGDSRDRGSISGLGGGNGNPLQYSCLENLMDRGAYSPRSGKESEMTKAT